MPPGVVLLLNLEDGSLDLEGRFVGVSIGASRPIFKTADAEVFISAVDLVARLSRDAELPAKRGHFFTL